MNNLGEALAWLCIAVFGGCVVAVVLDAPTNEPTPEPTPQPTVSASAVEEEPAGGLWLDWETAQAVAMVSGDPVLVFQHFADPEKHAACLPCLKLERLLEDPEVYAAVADLGVTCSATVEDWQPNAERYKAPAIAYVASGAKAGDKLPILTGFPVDDADKFLESLKVWIDKVE